MLFTRELRKLGYIIPTFINYDYLKYLVNVGLIPIIKTTSYDVVEFITLTKTMSYPNVFVNPIRHHVIYSTLINSVAPLSNQDIKLLLYKIKIGYPILKDIDRTIKYYTINKPIDYLIH